MIRLPGRTNHRRRGVAVSAAVIGKAALLSINILIAAKSGMDTGQALATDQVHVDGLALLAKLIKKRILDVDGTARRFVHVPDLPFWCLSHSPTIADAPSSSAVGTQ